MPFDLSRRRSLRFAACGLAIASSPDLAHGQDSRRVVLEGAITAFFNGWRTGDWADFLSRCADDFTFQFPAGPHKGRHTGPAGKAAIAEWCASHSKAPNRITDTSETLRMFDGDWVVVCDRGSGLFEGKPYTGLHAIFMKAGPGNKIIEFREYFGEI
jgi:ketosteroid isomerase-like protein